MRRLPGPVMIEVCGVFSNMVLSPIITLSKTFLYCVYAVWVHGCHIMGEVRSLLYYQEPVLPFHHAAWAKQSDLVAKDYACWTISLALSILTNSFFFIPYICEAIPSFNSALSFNCFLDLYCIVYGVWFLSSCMCIIWQFLINLDHF